MDFNFNIYPVITSEFCKNGSSVETLKILAKTGIKIVQLREKDCSKRKIFKTATEFRKITQRYGINLVINDHVDIALAVDAQGVHLGQGDLPPEAAKKIAPGLAFGISTHNLEEAKNAQKAGADYINIGPIFSTSTKETGIKPLGVEAIKKISAAVSIPFTVMGGIKENNIRDVLNYGAKRVAMVTEITMADDIMEKVARLKSIIEKYK